MVIPSAGVVVLVPFPFSGLSHAKLRSAVVLADAGRGGWVLSRVTSKPYGDPSAKVRKWERELGSKGREGSKARFA
jgi:mRNA interferase MazF